MTTSSSIYLAGKVGKNDWRHNVIPHLRGAWRNDGDPVDLKWPTLPKAVLDLYDYVGPYFMSDDHGCGHGPGTHGCGGEGGMCSGAYPTPGRTKVHMMCLDAIQRADIVFTWLDDTTAYGTLVELGYAHGIGKQVVVAASEEIDDLWFAYSTAHALIKATSPIEALKRLKEINPRLESEIERAFWKAHLAQRYPDIEGLVAQHSVLGGRYRLDFALPDKKIGIELDGYSFHSSPDAFTKDRQRQRELEANGWRIIRFSGAEVNADAAACVREASRLVLAIQSNLGSTER